MTNQLISKKKKNKKFIKWKLITIEINKLDFSNIANLKIGYIETLKLKAKILANIKY